MGCTSSKILTKSLSFREDFRKSSKGNRVVVNGKSRVINGEQSFFSLISKLQASDFVSPPKQSLETTTTTEIINTWELMAGLEEEQAEQKSKIQDKMKRSKSCELSSLSSLVTELDGLNENRFDFENKGVGRCRSFHTAEEYDAMIQRIALSRERNDEYVSTSTVQTPLASEPDVKEVLPSTTSSVPIEENDQETRICDVGLKRKAMAKGLESLQIPSNVEFKTIGSLRDWLHNGACVDSPGEYMTPKFGNYNTKPVSKFEGKYNDESMFNPELVAAFEEFMQQLEVEEENVLKQMEGIPDEIIDKDMSAEITLTTI